MQFLLYLATLNLIFICLVLHVLSTQFQNCCVHSFNSALSAQVEMETQCGCILLLCHLEWVIWFGCVHWSQRVNLVKSCSDSFQRHSFVWGWSEGWSAPRNLGWTYRSNQPTPRTAAFLFFFLVLGWEQDATAGVFSICICTLLWVGDEPLQHCGISLHMLRPGVTVDHDIIQVHGSMLMQLSIRH